MDRKFSGAGSIAAGCFRRVAQALGARLVRAVARRIGEPARLAGDRP
jgi:hypothetical protein